MILAVTPGDPAGIGPELAWKTLAPQRSPMRPSAGTRVVCFGATEPFERLGARVIRVDPSFNRESLPRVGPGEVLMVAAPTMAPQKRADAAALAGYQSGWSIEAATRAALAGLVDAVVTGPISKSRLRRGGFAFPGHTEMLASLCAGSRRRPVPVTMMLANDSLRVSLVTTHLPLGRVASHLNKKQVLRAIDQTVQSLRSWWGISRPRIGVCALNPHAGEGGLLGREEISVIAPAIRAAQKKHADTAEITGPHPADTLFARNHSQAPEKRLDAVVCMYHDQGLVPVKLIDFPRTVNITLGLPIIRTSVDHGVAFDLVGTGRADPSSFQSALALAERLAQLHKGKSK